jgi:hypothetical protein
MPIRKSVSAKRNNTNSRKLKGVNQAKQTAQYSRASRMAKRKK